MAARKATESDFRAVVETIAGAFYDDPLWSWVFPDPEARRRQQTAALGHATAQYLPFGPTGGNTLP